MLSSTRETSYRPNVFGDPHNPNRVDTPVTTIRHGNWALPLTDDLAHGFKKWYDLVVAQNGGDLKLMPLAILTVLAGWECLNPAELQSKRTMATTFRSARTKYARSTTGPAVTSTPIKKSSRPTTISSFKRVRARAGCLFKP